MPVKIEDPKIHPAIAYLNILLTSPPSAELTEKLSSFRTPKSIDPETFTAGVKKFIELANCNPLDETTERGRNAVYGDALAGLQYPNDIVRLWNAHHADEPIQAQLVTTIAPLQWESTAEDGFLTLVYKGNQPAQALDQLIKGPATIDCGMFTQLSLWFGIRYMLGDERFNHYFGRAPFYLTQAGFQRIEDSTKPYLGNPLHPFLSTPAEAKIPSVAIQHIANTPLYPLKHPGGVRNGENCVVIDGRYNLFGPLLENNQALPKSAVLDLLREALNEDKTQADGDRLALYAKTPERYHPILGETYSKLITAADDLRDRKLGEAELLEVKQPYLELTFDLDKFKTCMRNMDDKARVTSIEHIPVPIDSSHLPPDLMHMIPFENKGMDFSTFKPDTPQQRELAAISKRFCKSMMDKESTLVILSGKAGVGKTASAVCAAKDLAARRKRVLWISEVMAHRWMGKAESIEELNNCGREIDAILASNPDAVFLDDDNLAGLDGKVLLERIYQWYVNNPGKGLFITSNANVTFKDCYGWKLDGHYYYAPFCNYDSPPYQNQQYITGLAGESLRVRRAGQSIGAIVSSEAYQAHESLLGPVELIPAIDCEELEPIRESLKYGEALGPGYDKLRPVQQRWIYQHSAGGYSQNGGPYVKPYQTVSRKMFKNTAYKTIALEIAESDGAFGMTIDFNSMDHLIQVLNYAHDLGGKRVILINKTSFSDENLLNIINDNLPDSEKERTWSRFMSLLCENEETIFNHEDFNSPAEEPSEKIGAISARDLTVKPTKPPSLGDSADTLFSVSRRPRPVESEGDLPAAKPGDFKKHAQAMTKDRFNELMDTKFEKLWSQENFIKRVAKLDSHYHATNVEWLGMCWGISAMARDYFLISRFDFFSKLMLIINAMSEEKFAEELEGILQMGLVEKNQFVLTIYNSIQMLIGRASLYQAPSNYSKLILDAPNYPIIDTWEHVAPFAQTVDQNGDEIPSTPLASFSAAYTKDELITCLHLLEAHIDRNCAFNILSLKHSIMLNYSPASGWVLMDPNHLPSQSYATIEDLAQGLINACNDSHFGDTPQPPGSTIIFHANLYTTLSEVKDASTHWQKMTSTPDWKRLQRITPEKALLKARYESNLPMLACKLGDITVVREWLALITTNEASAPTNAEFSCYLKFAAACGNTDIVIDLIKYKPRIDCSEALSSANIYGHAAVISELLKDKTDEECLSFISDAVFGDRVLVISDILKKRPTIDCTEDFVLAAEHGTLAVVNVILEHRPAIKCGAALNKAVIRNRPEIVRAILVAQPTIDCKRAFGYAMHNGYIDIVRILLNQSTIPVEHIQTILAEVVARNKKELERGIDIVERMDGAVSVALEYLTKEKAAVHAEKKVDEEYELRCMRP